MFKPKTSKKLFHDIVKVCFFKNKQKMKNLLNNKCSILLSKLLQLRKLLQVCEKVILFGSDNFQKKNSMKL